MTNQKKYGGFFDAIVPASGDEMSIFLQANETISELKSRISQEVDEIKIAVAYWGQGAIELLGLETSKNYKIICNIDSGGCNPHEIRKIRAFVDADVRTHNRLHAKIYLTKNWLIVGSSNASTNGLWLESDGAKGLEEANILTSDTKLLSKAEEYFNKLWAESEEIDEERLKRAEELHAAKMCARKQRSDEGKESLSKKNAYRFAGMYVARYSQFIEEDILQKVKKTVLERSPSELHPLDIDCYQDFDNQKALVLNSLILDWHDHGDDLTLNWGKFIGIQPYDGSQFVIVNYPLSEKAKPIISSEVKLRKIIARAIAQKDVKKNKFEPLDVIIEKYGEDE